MTQSPENAGLLASFSSPRKRDVVLELLHPPTTEGRLVIDGAVILMVSLINQLLLVNIFHPLTSFHQHGLETPMKRNVPAEGAFLSTKKASDKCSGRSCQYHTH